MTQLDNIEDNITILDRKLDVILRVLESLNTDLEILKSKGK